MDFIIVFGEKSTTPIENIKKQATIVWREIESINHNLFTLVYPKSRVDGTAMVDTMEFTGCLEGWGAITTAHHLDESMRMFFQIIIKKWPVIQDDFTGCFSGIIFDKKTRKTKLFSDATGIYPLYFYINQSGYCIAGTSLIVIGRALSSKLDLCGVIQRMSPPDYINYGDRTILKEVKRLLPGEMLTIDQSLITNRTYDNSLFGQMESGNIRQQAESVWEIMKSDVKSCVNERGHIYIGMSGGWDSRFIAGALQTLNNSKTFVTFGMSSEEYEVKLAASCAKVSNANFVFCDFTPKYFPTYEEFSDNMKFGESLLITPWLAVLDAMDSEQRESILLGDMFEALVGRNIKELTSRKSRKTRFLNPKLTKQFLKASTNNDFEIWSSLLIDQILKSQMQILDQINLDYFDGYDTKLLLMEMLYEDLSKTINRVGAHELPYTILYDELFAWYTHGQSMGTQFLCLKRKHTPLAPTMGIRTLRATSKIDPISRADGRLLHEIQLLPDLLEFSKLPSAAIPFIPSYYPLIIKNLIWGIRSGLDQKLIRRAVASNNHKARQRVVKTIDFVALYNSPGIEQRINSWFENKLYKNSESFIELVRQRGRLESWPLPNMDIVGPASICILADLILHQDKSIIGG